MKETQQHLLNTFLSLVKIDSESYNEGKIQAFVAGELKKLGCRVQVDNAGKKFKTTAKGNVIGFLPGTIKSAPFVLVAHLDTVTPGNGVKPLVQKTEITSDGKTILGADDKAGVATALELVRYLQTRKLPHPPVEIVFTLCEENGMGGSKNLDISLIKGREGLVLDHEEINDLLVQGPAVNTIEVTIKGLAAHAGVCPEKGISAVEVAAYAIAQMKLGRIDKETVANIGLIQGGKATNIVTEEVYLKGEARSLAEAKLAKQTAHMKACFEAAAKKFTKKINGKICCPKITFNVIKRYSAVNVSKTHPVVKAVLKAAKEQGVIIRANASGGGCDANVLSGKGFTLPNLGLGVRNCHTVHEKLLLKEFFAAFEIVLQTVLNYKK